MVTPRLKDELLNLLCSNLSYENLYNVPKQELATIASENEIAGMLAQFNRMGLISDFSRNSSTYSISICMEASDFISRGGFEMQEEILKSNIEKLNNEIKLLSKELEPKMLEKAHLIASIGTSILNCVGLIKS